MALQYGMNITASDMKSLLEKNDKQQSGVRTWRQLFGNASLGYNAQADALTSDYSKAMAEAYASSFKQNDAIMGAGLSSGITKEMLAASRNDLHTAYETYIRNYGNDLNTAAQTYAEEVGAIDTALTERATNFSNLYNSAYKYLSEELLGATQTVHGNAENGAEALYEGEGRKAKFIGYADVTRDYITEHGLDWIYGKDENSETTDQIRSWDSLSHDLFNPDGSLTDLGIQFFDQMFNTTYEPYTHVKGDRAIRGFDEWLSETDSELRDWWVSQDAFNYNFAGTNRGTSQILTGRESTDNVYGKYEYTDNSGMSDYAAKIFDSSAAADAIKNQSDALKKSKEAAEKAKTANNPKQREQYKGNITGYQAAADKYAKDAQKAWNEYLSSVASTYNDLSTFFHQKMGTQGYEQFWSEYKWLKDDYDKLIKEAQRSGYNADVAARIENWYKNLLTQMNVYIKKNSGAKKTSGF